MRVKEDYYNNLERVKEAFPHTELIRVSDAVNGRPVKNVIIAAGSDAPLCVCEFSYNGENLGLQNRFRKIQRCGIRYLLHCWNYRLGGLDGRGTH